MFRAIVLAVLVLTCGCQLSSSTTRTAKVAGNVTLDGTPIATGQLLFQPNEAGSAPVQAVVSDGHYAAVVPQGACLVRITATKKTGRMMKEYSEEYPEVVSVLPQKYQDGISIEINADNEHLDFPLTSR